MKIYFLLLISLLMACAPSKVVTIALQNQPVNLQVDEIDGKLKVYRPSPTKVLSLHHTKLELRLNWQDETVDGDAELMFEPYYYSLDELSIDAKHFDIDRLEVYDKQKSLVFFEMSYDSVQIHLKLDTTFARKDTFYVRISYVAHPNKIINLKHKFDAITNEKGLYFINSSGEDSTKPTQVWTQGETHSSSNWFPTIDQPNIKMSQELSITVDSSKTTLSNGELIYSLMNADGTRTDYWEQEKKHSPYLVVLVVGDFDRVSDSSWNDIPFDYYMEPEFAPYAKEVFGHTPEMVAFYSRILGFDFPWDKYSQVVVRDFISGAMENTSASVFYSALNATTTDLIDVHYDGIIAHELFHQWFGDLVTSESWANLALNESFATYGEYLWNEYKYGKEEADYYISKDLKRYIDQSRTEQHPIIHFEYNHQDDLFDQHSYEKGGRILHMLRNYLGDETFFEGLSIYLNKFAYKTAEMHDLRMVYEALIGQDLNWFFNQWFYKSGHPKLNIYYTINDSLNTYEVEIFQSSSVEDGQLFDLPVKLEIHRMDTVLTKNIWIKGPKTNISLPKSDEIQFINFDADKILLAEIEVNHSMNWARFQYHNGTTFLDRSMALEKAINHQYQDSIASSIVISALKDPSPFIRSRAVVRLDLDETDKKLIDQLREMGLHDKNSEVRSKAVQSFLQLPCSEQAFIKDLVFSDSSYKVKATALHVLAKCNGAEALQLAASYENTKHNGLKSTVLTIYSKFGSIEQYNFFVELLSEKNDNALPHRLNMFARFLKNIKEESTLDNATSVLVALFEDKGKSYSMYLGTQLYQVLIDQYNLLCETIPVSDNNKRTQIKSKVVVLENKLQALIPSVQH